VLSGFCLNNNARSILLLVSGNIAAETTHSYLKRFGNGFEKIAAIVANGNMDFISHQPVIENGVKHFLEVHAIVCLYGTETEI
jgi:hypothetical protein